MHTLALITLLTSTVAAVDIRLWSTDSTCKSGTFYFCKNANPNVCCQIGAGTARAIQWAPYPKTWKIEMDAYTDINCKTKHGTAISIAAGTDTCLAGGSFAYKSGQYHFLPNKRDVEAEEANTARAATPCQRANFFHAANGTETSIAHLTDAEYAAFVKQNE